MAKKADGGSKPFSQVRRRVTPGRRIAIDAAKAAMDDAVALADLRASAGLTQAELAERLGMRQASLSAIERRPDVYLSTLRSYVEGLGGRVVIAAVFDDGTTYPLRVGTLEG